MKTVLRFLPLIAFLLVSCAPDDRLESDLDERIGRIENGLIENLQIKGQSRGKFNITDRMEELGIPGLSVAFAANGEIQWARAYGMADSSERRKMTTDTYLLAGSISKPVAAVRTLQLVQDGVFDLDENDNTYLTSAGSGQRVHRDRESYAATDTQPYGWTDGLGVPGLRQR